MKLAVPWKFGSYPAPDVWRVGTTVSQVRTRPRAVLETTIFMCTSLGYASLLASAILLTGCAVESNPGCRSIPVAYTDGKCSAYYYKTNLGAGKATTQAMVDCVIDSQRLGGNVVAFHSLTRGIGLRWLNSNTLEVLVSDDVELKDQRTGDDYLGYRVNYTFGRLRPENPEFTGCQPVRRNPG